MKFRTKKASSDFTADMLPKTRKALFFDVVKLQWQNLLLCGLILVIFGIPLLLSLGVEDIFVMSLSQSVDLSDETQLLQAGLAGILLRSDSYIWILASGFGAGTD